jgi:hypothetical protein
MKLTKLTVGIDDVQPSGKVEKSAKWMRPPTIFNQVLKLTESAKSMLRSATFNQVVKFTELTAAGDDLQGDKTHNSQKRDPRVRGGDEFG